MPTKNAGSHLAIARPFMRSARANMNIENKLSTLEELVKWQDLKIHGRDIPSDERIRLVVGLIDLALEHEKSIGNLAADEFYGSVFALSRPLFEAYIRAVWLRNCATSDEIQQFMKGKIHKNFGLLIEDIQKVQGYDVKVLSEIKNGYIRISQRAKLPLKRQ